MMHIWPGEDVWELWGLFGGRWTEPSRSRVAVFFTEEAAADYLQKSFLKKPTPDSAFRQTSLLYGARSAEIELAEAVYIEPHL